MEVTSRRKFMLILKLHVNVYNYFKRYLSMPTAVTVNTLFYQMALLINRNCGYKLNDIIP